MIDYTSRDYDGLKQSMLDYAAQIMPDWDTSSEGDFGVVMTELFAYAGDILSYYTDRVSQEAYLRTATQRLSLMNIAELLGYTPSNGVPATGTVTFQTDNPGNPVTIPAGSQVSTDYIESIDGPVIYETNEEVTVPGNGGTLVVDVTQGETQSMVAIGVSDGTPGQSFDLPQLNVIDGSVHIFVETAFASEEWVPVAFLVDADPSDKVYTVRVDDTGATVISFGDNVNGLIPTLGLHVWATYRIGMGAMGNQPAGAVNTIVSELPEVVIPTEEDGTYISSAMIGGADAESNESIRANAPLAFRTQYRAVSNQDFEDLAMSVPGVTKAHAVARHYTSITLYIVGPNGQDPSDKLVEDIMDYFADKTLAGVSLSILGPKQVLVNIGADVDGQRIDLHVKDRYSRAQVASNVTKALQTMLSTPNVNFGMHLSISDIYHTIMAVDGVDWVVVPFFARADAAQTGTADIDFRDAELPLPGNIVIQSSGGMA